MRAIRNHIGFISTRFKGNDGVSLEAEKWLEVLTNLGHTCYLFAGDSDEKEERYTYIVPEAHFTHPEIESIYNIAFSSKTRPPEISRTIQRLKDHLKQHIYKFIYRYHIDLLIVENALAIPLNIPLGLAITEFIAETDFPTIAHHHDFFWERKRFLVNCVWDLLNMAFPPHLPSIHHVVINSSGSNQLSLRTGISSMLIPNVMDFDNAPPPPDEYSKTLRKDIGVAPDELLFLQPTRVVQRKGIEHAIELIHRLGLKACLVISHANGDEGHEYEQHIRLYANLLDVSTIFVSDLIRSERGVMQDGRKIYQLRDAYQNADLVTYPSSIEGFGNAFLEAIYYKRPIVVNSYSIFATDIKPKGFNVIEFDGYITEATLSSVRQVLNNPDVVQEMVDHNYRLAKKHYSYKALERNLHMLLMGHFGYEE